MRRGLEQEVEQAMPLSTLASAQPNQGPKLLERPSYALLLSTCAATTPGGARAAAVVHGAVAVVLGRRSVGCRDGLIRPTLTLPSIHPRGTSLHPRLHPLSLSCTPSWPGEATWKLQILHFLLMVCHRIRSMSIRNSTRK